MRIEFQKPPGDRARTVQIPVTRGNLQGELWVSPDATGVVLFVHGSGSSRHSPRNQDVARVMRESGMGTLLVDLLTPEEQADDNITSELRFDIELLARRLVSVTHWLAEQRETGRLGVAYFGSSTGAGAALVAAAELGHKVDAVVSRGGRPDLSGHFLAHVRCPTLLIVGERDEVVLRLNEEALERLRCPKELIVVPGATHLFEENGALEQVAQVSAGWFVRYLCLRRKATGPEVFSGVSSRSHSLQ
jgi:putative phosphoribosyl transferase